MKRIIRDRHLTPEEAAKYNAIREEIEREKPEINARIRSTMAMKDVQEHDQVVLTSDLPEYDLRRGDIGVVVIIHGDESYDVEFAALDGQRVAVVSLDVLQVRPTQPGEIAHVRSIDAAIAASS